MMVVAARLLAIDVVRILLSAIDGSSIILAHLEHLIKQRRSLAKTSVANDSFTVIAKDILINETVGTDRLEAANTLRLTDNQLLAKKKVTFDTIISFCAKVNFKLSLLGEGKRYRDDGIFDLWDWLKSFFGSRLPKSRRGRREPLQPWIVGSQSIRTVIEFPFAVVQVQVLVVSVLLVTAVENPFFDTFSLPLALFEGCCWFTLGADIDRRLC